MKQTTSLLALVALCLGAASCVEPVAPPPLPPPPVTVELPVVRDVVRYQDFTGHTAAVASVEVRARVSGFLDAMHFEIATEVEVGAPLFTIEKDSYQASRDSAAAALASAQANAQRAQADLARAEVAVQQNAISRQELALRVADRDMANAAVLQAEARLAEAELQLGYCEVTSPLAGQVSRNYVDVGNLVGGPQATLLAEVVQMDPIYVYFEASEAEVLRHLRRGVKRDSQRLSEPVPALLALGDDEGYPHEGRIDYIDNRVDTTTGTLEVRGTFSNADRSLFPGLFARVRLPGDTIQGAVLVRESAIGSDLGGKFLMTVDEQGLAQQARVQLGQLEGELRVVLSGLAPEQRYIVKGLQRARAGMPVTVTDDAGAPPPREAKAATNPATGS